MHILFFAPRFHTNQVACVRVLKEKGHIVSFWTLNKGQSEDYSLISPDILEMSPLWCFFEKRLVKFREPMFRRVWALISPLALIKKLKIAKPDVVILREPFNFPGIIFIFACHVLNIPYVIYTQGQKYRKAINWRIMIPYLLFTDLLGISWYTPVLGNKNEENVFNLRNFRYLPFCCYPHAEDTSYSSSKYFGIHILDIGKFEKRKNHILLVRALALLMKDYNFTLTIVGECTSLNHEHNLDELKTVLRETGMNERTRILLNQQPATVQNIYPQHDVLVLPATAEPASISNLEAMAYGLPVICSNSNGTACYTTHGVNGLLFNDGDLSSLIAALQIALADGVALKKMGLNALATVKATYNPDLYYTGLMKAIHETRGFGL